MTLQKPLLNEGKMQQPAVVLMPTTTAIAMRSTVHGSIQLDGPLFETIEQLVGIYLIDVESLEAALQAVKDLAAANPAMGSYEIRPVSDYHGSEHQMIE